MSSASGCCGSATEDRGAGFVVGQVETASGVAPRVSSRWGAGDYLGACRVRWGIGRDRYRVAAGLYGIGSPSAGSPVLVTANYKLTFDVLRRELQGVDAWLLVLDTRGVNVWCAAGKGTFSADELVRQIEATDLPRVATTRTLLLPQLAGPGVAAHEVTRATGYRVAYGPVRAADIRAYLSAGWVKTPAMARVEFGLADRLRVVPVELGAVFKYLVPIIMAYVALRWALSRQVSPGPLAEIAPFAGAALVGTALFPVFLPLNVFRSFAAGGAFLGLLWAVLCGGLLRPHLFQALALLLLLPAISGFLAMQFTGSSTFTSLAGVRKEIRIALPALIVGAAMGCLSLLAGLFFAPGAR